jgi:hypothetical protein
LARFGTFLHLANSAQQETHKRRRGHRAPERRARLGHFLLRHQPLVDHEARQVRQPPRDARLAAGVASDGPAPPKIATRQSDGVAFDELAAEDTVP